MARRPGSVRVRVTSVAAAVVLAATLVGSGLFVLTLRNALEAGLESNAREEIATIAAQLRDGLSPEQVAVTGRGDVVVQLVGPDGRVVASDHPRTLGRPLLTGPGVDEDLAVPGERDQYSVVARRISGHPRIALVVVGRSTEQADRARDIALLLLALAVPFVTGLLAATVWVSVGRALRPVEAMRREADEITSTGPDRRLPRPPGDDEIHRLALTLNRMLDRIEVSQRSQRQFVSDASHELRSPLSVIRQAAQVAHDYPDRVTLSGFSDDVLTESARMQHLVDALLLLARLDEGLVLGAEDVDVDDLVLTAVAGVGPLREGLSLDLTQVSSGQVHGHPVLLAQVVRNLVDNALRHARSEVAVTLREWQGRVELFVDDDGDGIPPGERDRVFERFVRLDEGRARDAGGSGLGLAIVRQIVGLHHGTVSLGASALGGARFAVELPASV